MKPNTHWLDEGEMELDTAKQPMEMEQPTNLIVQPLQAEDDSRDRVRTIFALTSDDRLPKAMRNRSAIIWIISKTRLAFPFAGVLSGRHANKLLLKANQITAVGLASPSPENLGRGLFCRCVGKKKAGKKKQSRFR